MIGIVTVKNVKWKDLDNLFAMLSSRRVSNIDAQSAVQAQPYSGFLLPSFPLDKHSESRVIQFSSVSSLGPSPKVSDRIPWVDYGVLG